MLEIADSFARKGDSVNSTAYLMKVNSNCLIYLGFTPEDIDKKLDAYRMMANEKLQYRELFMKAYNRPDAKVGDTLFQMVQEDQATRDKLGKCNDSFSCAIYQQKMRYSDSIHFTWLYSYIRKNGWPTIENGSACAAVIAMHDRYHHCDYLPCLRKAVLDGEVPYAIYNNILNRCLKPSFGQMMKEYRNKTVFDVSYILKGKKIDTVQLQKIYTSVNEHLPIKYIYFVYESQSRDDFMKWGNSVQVAEYWESWDLMVYINRCHEKLTQIKEFLPYQYAWSESSLSGKGLKLYLLY
jgi:hypothetical protein